MTLSIHSELPPLRTDPDGVVRVADTRIPLERVVRAFLSGMTAEQIAHDFDVLRVADIYAVINYYLHHREDVDDYLAAVEGQAAATRHEVEAQFDPAGVRARLLARQKPKAG